MVELELPARHDWAVQEKNYGKLVIERGRGYVSAEKREPEALPINAILLDADFSPVKRVNFHVEAVATGRERLVLEVWTDGSVAPTAAVGEASRIKAVSSAKWSSR